MAASFSSLSLQLGCLLVIVAAFNSAIAYVNPDVVIPPGYTIFNDINAAYKVHTESKSWTGAKQICNNEGAHLAIIDTRQKVQYVANMKAFNVYVWIGAFRTDPSAAWLTVGNDRPMLNIPWAPGKPDGQHNCLAVRGCNRGLTNENCSGPLGFVCEILLNPDVDIQIN